MQKGGLIQNTIVSYKISRLADGADDGEITLGAMDPSKYVSNSVVTFNNVNAQGFWEGAVDSFSVDGQELGLSGRTAILDTGTVSYVQC